MKDLKIAGVSLAVLAVFSLSGCAKPIVDENPGAPASVIATVSAEPLAPRVSASPIADSDAPIKLSSEIEASQDSADGALMLYLKAASEADTATMCQVIDPAVKSRIKSLGDSCESAYRNSYVPEPAQHLAELEVANLGPSFDGRGVRVKTSFADASYTFTAVNVDGVWFIDPESFSQS